jgi:hypothetical protein
MHKFSPSVGVIEARLRSSKNMEQSDALASIEINAEPAPLSMPAFINNEIARTVAAQAIKDTPVESGAIVLVTSLYGDDGQVIEQLRSPIAFCLDAKKVTRGDISEWTGWMVSPDCDYATEKDVLLEPGDGPFDPSAGMVQTWNRLTLRIPSRPRVLAKLSDFRLSILREVETEGKADIPPRPGHIASRVTPTKRTVLTGSPLRRQNDLRNDYRQLYTDRAQEIAVKQAVVVREMAAAPPLAAAKTGGMMAWLMGHRLQMAGLSATLAGVMIAAHLLLKEPEAPGTSPVQIARVDTPTVSAPPAPAVSPVQEAPVGATVPTHPPRAEKSAVSKPNLGKTVAPTQMAKVEPPVIAEPGTTESGAQKEGRRPMPLATPILLASLDEAQFAIPMVRSVGSKVTGQTSPDSTPVLLEAPTHVLRVVDRKSVSLAIARLAAMGIQAIPASSPVPAVVFSLPKGMPVAEIEAKLAGDELFLPRAVWLRPKGE